jgi:hypothetical protein
MRKIAVRTVLSNDKNIPDRLYKYRSFNNRTLDQLVADQLFFADPGTFNDPLDTRPSLHADLDADTLEDILRQLVEERIKAEMGAAARAIKYRGPKTHNHIAVHSRRHAEQVIANVRYHATNPDYENDDDPARFLFGHHIEEELWRRYDKGIVSLAERAECPLMWSHYGDQHKGVCIGYSIPDGAEQGLYKITYGGSRLVEASAVASMLEGDNAAQRKVDEAVLSRKADEWGYEREWRLVGPRGLQDSPLELEEVVFGMRCSLTVRYAMVKALADRRRPVNFYQICEHRGEFRLDKYPLDTCELTASLPRRALDIRGFFEPMVDDS